MKKDKRFIALLLGICLLSGCATLPEKAIEDPQKEEEPSVRHFILGTDWGTDCDDAAAIRILARAVNRGEIALDGIIINHEFECSVASLDGYLQEEGIGTVPIGIDKQNDATVFEGEALYQPRLVSLATRYHSNNEAEDGVRLYRRILANARDKVEILEIGFLQVLGDLLVSNGDDISPLSGKQLVKEKVSHIWCMGGRWDQIDGKEFNFSRRSLTANGARRLCSLAECPVTFLGFEIGCDVYCGASLQEGDTLKQIFTDYGVRLRPSWDPLLVSLALIGDPEEAGYTVKQGKAQVNGTTGVNNFTESAEGNHFVVVRAKESTRFYFDQIDNQIK